MKTKNTQRIKNWQHLCIWGRLTTTTTKIDGTILYHDNRKILVKEIPNGTDLAYLDYETGEILLVQGEDGFPNETSEWAERIPEGPYEIA